MDSIHPREVERITSKARNYLRKAKDKLEEYRIYCDRLDTAIGDFQRNPTIANKVWVESFMAYFEKYILQETDKPRRDFKDNEKDLVIYVDGYWRAFEFDKLFKSVDFLNKFIVLEYKLKRQEVRVDSEMTRFSVYEQNRMYFYLTPFEELTVKEIHFSSPGHINFKGLSDSIKEVAELIKYVIELDFIKKVIDKYYEIKRSRLAHWKEESFLKAAIAKCEADEQEEQLRKERIERERNILNEKYHLQKIELRNEAFKKLNEMLNSIDELNSKGLVKKEYLEESLVEALNNLHQLGYERDKIGLIPLKTKNNN